MKWKQSKDKTIIIKDGVYFGLTKDQLEKLKLVIKDIESGDNKLLINDGRGA